MRTLLVGNFGAKNLGDELILLAALKDYSNATVMTANSAWTQSFCEAKIETAVFPPTAFRSWWRYFASRTYRQQVQSLRHRFDRIIFVGGGLFAIKLRACFLWWQVFGWLKHLNPEAEIWFEHQGVDAGLPVCCRWMVKQVFSQADFVSLRDEASLQAVKKLNIGGVELKTDRFWQADFGWQSEAKKRSIVLVNALQPIDENLLKKIVEGAKSHSLVFVAFQQSDLKFVPAAWPGQVEFPATKTDLFRLFDQADIVIGERLHCLLVGSKELGPEHVKLLRTPYAEKVEAFAKTLGWEKF